MGAAELDLVDLLSAVVQPCIAHLLRPGELESLTLSNEPLRVPEVPADPGENGITAVPSAAVSWRVESRPYLSMILKGERFQFVFWPTARIDPYPREEVENQRDALFEALQDFIVQSKFAWGDFRR